MFAGNKYADLSETCLYYIGGIIKHAKAINAFTNPPTNSYKRLVPGYEAPVLLAYSARNRSASCRIPYTTNPKAKRVEVRFPDPMANPYLAFAAMLMAGLDGIKNKIDPGPAMDKDLYDLPQEELKTDPDGVRLACAKRWKTSTRTATSSRTAACSTTTSSTAYIELKMAEVDALRDDPASGRIRHVLFAVILSGGHLPRGCHGPKCERRSVGAPFVCERGREAKGSEWSAYVCFIAYSGLQVRPRVRSGKGEKQTYPG